MSGTRMSVPPKFPSNAPTVLSNGRLYNGLLSTGKSLHFVYIMYPTSKLEHRHFIVSKDYVFLRIGSFAIVSKIYYGIQGWKNPLVRSPWRVPYAVGRVEILTVSNVNY